MNKSILINIFLLFSSSLFAQNIEPLVTTKKPFQIQAGVNVISFVRQFMNFSGNNSNGTTSPYSVNVKAFKQIANQDALIGIRLGTGYVNNNSVTESSISVTNILNETFDFRVGIEYQKAINKKWIGYVGIDYISQKISNNNNTRYFDAGVSSDNIYLINRTTKMDGAGFVFGMQFYVTKRIALATEATYYYSDIWYRNSVFNTTSPNNQPPSITKTSNTTLTLPNLLNFTVSF